MTFSNGLLFVVDYTDWRLSKSFLMVLGIPSIITQIFVWTALDRFFILNWHLVDLGILRIDVVNYSDWFFIQFGFNNFFLLLAILRLLYYGLRIESMRRAGIWWIIFGAIITRLLSLVDILYPELQIPRLTPLGFGVLGVSMGLTFLRYDFFRVIPIAYDVVVQNMRAAVFILNRSKDIIQINPYTESLLNQPKSTLLYQAISSVFQTYFEQAFPTNVEEHVWNFQQTKQDKVYHYEATLSTLKRGKLSLGYLLTLRDISIYKEAEVQALALKLEQERVRLLSEFITYTSHDLRNPLATINSAVYTLQKSPDDMRRQNALERIKEQSAHIEKLLGQFHSFIRLEAGERKDVQAVSIQSLLNAKAEKYRPVLGKHQISFHYTTPAAHLMVHADSDFLRQAVQALLDNAIIYNQAQGEIWLEAREEAETVCIIVRDTGIGIPPEKLSQIFESFYKGNEARTHDGSGAGLGLAFVKRVAALYHGDIQITSEQGKGTTARLILPLAPEA